MWLLEQILRVEHDRNIRYVLPLWKSRMAFPGKDSCVIQTNSRVCRTYTPAAEKNSKILREIRFDGLIGRLRSV